MKIMKKEKPSKYLYIDADKKQKLAEDNKTSYQNVCKSLNFKSQSALAVKIRAMAKNRGAILYDREVNTVVNLKK